MNRVIKISGLDCANCARELEEEIEKIEGVTSVSVDFMAQRVVCECTDGALEKVKYACNHFEEVKVVEEPAARQLTGGERVRIKGLCCANCGRELEEILNKIEGVEAVVDFMNMTVTLVCDSPEARSEALRSIEGFEDVKIVRDVERRSVLREHLRDLICIIVSAVLFIPALVFDLTGLAEEALVYAALMYVFYAAAYLVVGYKVLWLTAKNIVRGRIFDENFLMTVASIGAILLGIFSGDGFTEGVAVMLLYQIGELLQAVAVGSSRSSITELMNLKSETATLIDGGATRTLPPEELKEGDRILIRAGEKVPVDCRIASGRTSLDTKSLSGEPVPRDCAEGDEILSGSINLTGAIEAVVLREYSRSAVAKILEMVESSTSRKSRPERFITRFAKYYTPAVCLAAALVAALVPTAICAAEGAFVWETYSAWIYKALGFLVISCPCALVISVPLSYFGGIGRCARSGILVKGSTCLDSLALCTVAAFDKTGTVTEGAFAVKSYTDGRTLRLAAAAERFSSHPIAAAFGGVETDFTVTEAEELAGRGVKCLCEGQTLLCGNASLLRDCGVAFEESASLSTLVYVALDGRYVGVIEIDDCIKRGARGAVCELKKQGIARTVMLTGDLKERAEAVAMSVGIDECRAQLLPDEKLAQAEELKRDGKLLYVGDGINDAPVMTAADCAVSMGKVGSDAAIEASDIVLVGDSLALIPKGRRIARGTRRIVMQNIVGSLIIKAAIMALDIAIAGFPLIVSIAADVGVMLLAVLNAMRTALIR